MTDEDGEAVEVTRGKGKKDFSFSGRDPGIYPSP